MSPSPGPSRLLFVAALVLLRSEAPARPESSGGGDVLVLTGATLIDGTGAPPRAGVSIAIRDGAIEAIAAGPPAGLPDGLSEGARVADLAGKFVVPGLFDVHTHLATNPGREGFEEALHLELRQLLARGITDVRDMAGDGRVLARAAAATASGELPGPDIHFATILAGADYFDDPRLRAASRGVEPGKAAWAHELAGDTDLAALMDEARDFGSTGIKVYANVSPDLLGAAAETARERGLRVWSHWVVTPGETSALDAVQAGVEVVSHAYMLMYEVTPEERKSWRATFEGAGGQELVDAMLERGTILDATLVAARGLRPPPGSGWEDPLTTGAEITRLVHEAGVPVAAGTDRPAEDGVPALHAELALLCERAGFEPLEALESATSVGAACVGLEAGRGTLEVGKRARLLVLDEDPSRSVAALREPRYVLVLFRVFLLTTEPRRRAARAALRARPRRDLLRREPARSLVRRRAPRVDPGGGRRVAPGDSGARSGTAPRSRHRAARRG